MPGVRQARCAGGRNFEWGAVPTRGGSVDAISRLFGRLGTLLHAVASCYSHGRRHTDLQS
jgi:hypothetical protein